MSGWLNHRIFPPCRSWCQILSGGVTILLLQYLDVNTSKALQYILSLQQSYLHVLHRKYVRLKLFIVYVFIKVSPQLDGVTLWADSWYQHFLTDTLTYTKAHIIVQHMHKYLQFRHVQSQNSMLHHKGRTTRAQAGNVWGSSAAHQGADDISISDPNLLLETQSWEAACAITQGSLIQSNDHAMSEQTT